MNVRLRPRPVHRTGRLNCTIIVSRSENCAKGSFKSVGVGGPRDSKPKNFRTSRGSHKIGNSPGTFIVLVEDLWTGPYPLYCPLGLNCL